MRNNPYPDEPASTQPTERIPPTEPMEDLPAKQTPPPAPQTPVIDTATEADIAAETRQEEARTVKYAINKLNDFLRWFSAVLEVTLGIRFFLKLISADPNNLFAGFLFALTDIVLFPFSNIVRPTSFIEWSTLIAMLMYWLIFWAIRRFLHILVTGPEEPAN